MSKRHKPLPTAQPLTTTQPLTVESSTDEEDDPRLITDPAESSDEEEVAIVESAPANKHWHRKILSPEIFSKPIVFQHLHTDHVIGESDFLPGRSGRVPILRLHGVTREGHSVCCRIHGFDAYFYLACPSGTDSDAISLFQHALEARLKKELSMEHISNYILQTTLVHMRSFHGYTQDEQPFLKIVVALPSVISICRRILSEGIKAPFDTKAYATFESDVPFSLRFVIDNGIVTSNWMEVAKYRRSTIWSSAQLEINCLHTDIVSHNPIGEYVSMAPFRILSMDIIWDDGNGLSRTVIQVAIVLNLHGVGVPLVQNVLTVGSCLGVEDACVLTFDSEKDLLLALRDLILASDPDILNGYGICGYDFPFLVERAQSLDIQFPIPGRVSNRSGVKVKPRRICTRKGSTLSSKEVTIGGRVQIDLLQAIQRDYKLESYSLYSASHHFLKEEKEYLPPSIISKLHAESSETRGRLAAYCLKNACVSQRLLHTLNIFSVDVEMARVTGVPISFSRIKSMQVLCQVLRKTKPRKLLVPYRQQSGYNEKYKARTMLDPKAAYYAKPVAVLEFVSLHPSIIIAYNMCPSTLVTARSVMDPASGITTYTPTGAEFVILEQQKGILPEILEELLAVHQKAKEGLKEDSDAADKDMLVGHFALKCAHTVYDITASTHSQFYCKEIAESVTSYGRLMIDKAKKWVDNKHAQVIFGDTGSLMVDFSVDTLPEALKLGREAGDTVSKFFPKPIKLELEKAYMPFILLNKARYAGLPWKDEEIAGRIDVNGIESVRTDSCDFVKDTIGECLKEILTMGVPAAVKLVRKGISELCGNRVNLSRLIITQELTKPIGDYKKKMPHVKVAEQLQKRNPASAVAVGDRVPYLIIKGAKGAQVSERAEDPLYVLDNDLPVDISYYMERLKKPLVRIFTHVLKVDEKVCFEELFKEQPTEPAIDIATSSKRVGLMRYTKKCFRCKANILTDRTLCMTCKESEAEIFDKEATRVKDLEDMYQIILAKCHACQGSERDVLCMSQYCPTPCERKKAEKDKIEARAQLNKWR